jgi:16S rRNA (cytosine967-C5)-methyltransferase
MGVTPARRAALEVMRRVRDGDLLDRALERIVDRLPPRDRAWTRELLYGSFRLRGRLDWWLGAHVKGGLGRLDPEVLDILRLGTYQLREMGGVPAYAAISESVDLARTAGAGRAAGLVNAVLRALQRTPAPDASAADPDPVKRLSTWGSHPEWLVRRWIDRFGAEETGALVEVNNRRPELYLHSIDMPREEAIATLADAGIEAAPASPGANVIRLAEPSRVADALERVPAVVQDPAATLVVDYARVPRGGAVIDLCAAPGGKTLGLAERAGWVVAGDLSARRLARVRENIERVGRAPGVFPVVADGRRPPFRAVDAVLLDAPCTGTGTLRRHPDGRWRLAPADVETLAALQTELLQAAAGLVRPGGLLIYATCSLEPEENEEQVQRFLEMSPDFTLAPPAELDPAFMDGGMLRVLPQRHGTDGSFAARMERAR